MLFTVFQVEEETRLNRWMYTNIEADDEAAAIAIAKDDLCPDFCGCIGEPEYGASGWTAFAGAGDVAKAFTDANQQIGVFRANAIPVSDRLPPVDECVLAFMAQVGWDVVRYGGPNEWIHENDDMGWKVTHWMPLPPAPAALTQPGAKP
jgi:hypothetical protein